MTSDRILDVCFWAGLTCVAGNYFENKIYKGEKKRKHVLQDKFHESILGMTWKYSSLNDTALHPQGRDTYSFIHSGLWFYSLVFFYHQHCVTGKRMERVQFSVFVCEWLPDQQSCPGSPVVGLLWWFVLEKENTIPLFLHCTRFFLLSRLFLVSSNSFHTILPSFSVILVLLCVTSVLHLHFFSISHMSCRLSLTTLSYLFINFLFKNLQNKTHTHEPCC